MKESIKAINYAVDINELDDYTSRIETARENQRINPEDFYGHKYFTNKEIQQDIEHVRAKQDKTKLNTGTEMQFLSIAKFVEAGIIEAIKDAKWFGDSVKCIRPALYDDFFNSIDSILEFTESPEQSNGRPKCTGLSIDFTTSHEEAGRKFMDTILRLLEKGPSKIKYFETTDSNGNVLRLKNLKLPRIIVECSGELLMDTEEILLAYEESNHDSTSLKRVENCRFRFVMIKEILMQLRFIADIFAKLDMSDVHQLYQQSLDHFERALQESHINPEDLDRLSGNHITFVDKLSKTTDSNQLIKILSHMKTHGMQKTA